MIKRVHRIVSLAFALLWLIQAATGTLLTFRWELDDAALAGASVPLDPAALSARIAALRAGGSDVSSVWASGGDPDRFDIFHSRGGVDTTTRVDGRGAILRERTDAPVADGGIWDTLIHIHYSLLAGDIGEWFMGLTGVLLLTNLILGLKLAWPRKRWATALFQRPRGGVVARTYGWHRTLGLWVGVPAAALVTAGVLLSFEPQAEAVLGAEHREPDPPAVAASARIDAAAAMRIALARYPGSTLSGLSLPSDEARRFRFRLNAPGETNRIYGATVVTLAEDGRVIYDHDARASGAGRWTFDMIYPFHTGQAGGLVGRLLTLVIGLWLVTMIVFGTRLWWLRRPKPKARPVRVGAVPLATMKDPRAAGDVTPTS